MGLAPKVTERIPGQLLVSEDLPLGLTLQMRIRSLARSLSQFTGKVWQTLESGSTGASKVFDELLEVGKTV